MTVKFAIMILNPTEASMGGNTEEKRATMASSCLSHPPVRWTL